MNKPPRGPAHRQGVAVLPLLLSVVMMAGGLAACAAGTDVSVETAPPAVEPAAETAVEGVGLAPPTGEPTRAATAAPQPTSTRLPASDQGHIVDLMDEGKLEIRVQGEEINTLRLELRNLTGDSLDVDIPAGTFFIANDSTMQNMVVRHSQTIRLANQDWKSVQMDVACANMSRDIPGSETGFAVRRSPLQSDLELLMMSLDQAGAEYDVEQAAVWIVTDNASYGDMGILVRTSLTNPIGSRVIGYDDAVRAMQLVDGAGIDITRTVIWNDRTDLSLNVENSDLALWLHLREGRAGAGPGAPRGEVVLSTDDPVFSAAFVPGAPQVVTSICLSGSSLRGCTQGEMQLWDSLTGELLLSFGRQPAGHSNLTFSPDGSRMASVACEEYDADGMCINGTIHLWDTESWEELGLLENHPERVEMLAFTPDAGFLAAKFCAARVNLLCEESAIWVWDVAAREVIHQHRPGLYSSSLAVSPDGRMLAAPFCTAPSEEGACLGNEMWVWDVASGALLQQLPLDGGGWRVSTGFSAGSDSLIAVGSLPGDDTSLAAWLWDTGSGELTGQMTIDEGDLYPCTRTVFAPAREIAAVGQCEISEERTVTAANILFWDLRTGAPAGGIDIFSDFIGEVDLASDGTQIVVRSLGDYPVIIHQVR